MKQFITAAKEAIEAADDNLEEGLLEFELVQQFADDRPDEVRKLAAHKPDDGQLGILIATVGGRSNKITATAGTINFFMSLFDDDDAAYLESRLLDRKDKGLKIEKVSEILEWFIEEWTGNPTDEPSGSTRSQSSGTKKSTRRTPALT